MNMKSIIAGSSFLLIVFVSGCYYDKEELLYPNTIANCTATNSRFTDVQSIVALKCATTGCHNAGAAAGGVVLETYDQIRSVSNRILQRVIIDKTMPPGAPLTAEETAILQCWINAGTPNN